MTTLEQKAAEAKAKMQGGNPSVTPGKTEGERKRIPMTLPTLKLEVPEIPGYHLHWMRGTSQRLQQAQNAGYEFVAPEEVQINSVSIGGDAKKDGNTDLGSRVSIVGGTEVDTQGQAVRLYLMKQKMEHFLEDQEVLGKRNDSIAGALTASYRTGAVGGAAPGETAADVEARYVRQERTKVPDFFRKKRPS